MLNLKKRKKLNYNVIYLPLSHCGVKTLTERLDSQPEEKAEVKLRKKNKTSADRPVSGAEQRLSKGLFDKPHVVAG